MFSQDVNKFTAIDLFSGVGGLTCGLKKSGYSVLMGVEIDKETARVYECNHPEVFIESSDIRNIEVKKVRKSLELKKGELTLLAGCPPCQGFSTLRTNNKATSFKDDKNDLIFNFIDWVEEFMPEHVLLENVPPLIKDERIKKVLARLKSLGYFIDDFTVRIENVADYSVPQRRKRLVLICSRIKKTILVERIKSHKTVRDAIFHLDIPGISGDPLHDRSEKRSSLIMERIKSIPHDGGSRDQMPYHLWLDCHKRYPGGFKDVYGRMKWDTLSPTITGGCVNPSKGRFLHPEQNRAITLREAALLQGFPESYNFMNHVAKEKIAQMIGNAVPPVFVQHFASALIGGKVDADY